MGRGLYVKRYMGYNEIEKLVISPCTLVPVVRIWTIVVTLWHRHKFDHFTSLDPSTGLLSTLAYVRLI